LERSCGVLAEVPSWLFPGGIEEMSKYLRISGVLAIEPSISRIKIESATIASTCRVTWFLVIREEHELVMFQKRVLLPSKEEDE
jgi:hypothetical protein